MAKFLDTRKCAAEISDLIKNSGSDLILISPYLQLSKDFRELLAYRDKKGKRTTLIFREPNLSPDDIVYFRTLRHVTLRFHEDLHAKCYTSADRMIITSMNLYQFSMDHNKEMGVLAEKALPSDSQLFQDTLNEVQYIIETSRLYVIQTSGDVIPSPTNGKALKTTKKGIGFCIRTGVEIPFNIDKPLSPDAYKKWKEFGNPEYAERYCHFSGELSGGETSVSKPILKKYWKDAQNLYGL
ncbi:phospholipase D family protein [Dinghuibacter silviterrae]|uniref:Phospholipase D-like protein n=1 Tax=Dinghuibacter silviterrae TaxID=1539049 RepID=A0A4V3GKR3_9BACT|nr:phospholipase D family protein [Dinghuibacter silviterrae]TDW96662.1 phospholipase D-like protein [Dinghuibacter silviterrae]